MGYGTGQRGRPRKEGERYPNGELRPKQQVPIDPAREPISGAAVQRMFSADVRRFREADFGDVISRLWTSGQLTSSEVATGLRFAGIYGRFEFNNGLSRSAAAPHYIREYISEGVGAEQPRNPELPEDRERRAREIDVAFKALQHVLSPEHRAVLEALFVDGLHVGHHLPKAKTALAILAEYFREETRRAPKKDRKKKRRPRSAASAIPTPSASLSNPLKEAFFAVRRKRSPSLPDADLEAEWNVLCALKARSDFRQEKSERGST